MREWTPDTGVDVNGMALKNHQSRCSIWLSFTSNLISSGLISYLFKEIFSDINRSGLRDIFVYLAKEGLIDVVVTSAGGVEEDFIKCFAPTFIGDFESKVSFLNF
jgi:deoxyhypusine synthase